MKYTCKGALSSAPKLLTVAMLSIILVACGGGTSGDETDAGSLDSGSSDDGGLDGDFGELRGDGIEVGQVIALFQADDDGGGVCAAGWHAHIRIKQIKRRMRRIICLYHGLRQRATPLFFATFPQNPPHSGPFAAIPATLPKHCPKISTAASNPRPLRRSYRFHQHN